jgi:hypothetical protein
VKGTKSDAPRRFAAEAALDLDLEHALVNVHHAYNRRTKQSKTTKTGNTRRVPVHENLLQLLRAMHAEANGEGLVLALPSERTMARSLRRWLRRAGVTREELYEASPTRKPITWHDARATGITWLAVAGLDASKIQRRAGHTTIETTMGYIHEAESFAGEEFGTPFRRCRSGSWGTRPPSGPRVRPKGGRGRVAGCTGLEPARGLTAGAAAERVPRFGPEDAGRGTRRRSSQKKAAGCGTGPVRTLPDHKDRGR